MLGTHDLPPLNLQALPPEAAAWVARWQHAEQQLALREQALVDRDRELDQARDLLQRKDRDIAWRDAKIEKITFELARLKRWKFGASSEAMNTDQRRLFEETIAEDEASLRAQLEQLRREAAETTVDAKPKAAPQRPRRQQLPEHLRRVEHRHEPESTNCPAPNCGRPMTRIGEDMSERLDIVPAEFFVHRHIYGKWACRCCQILKQAPSIPELIEGGMAASGLIAHTLISRCVDHLPYYRQEAINARSGVHTPRSTLAAWAGQAGAALEPLYEVHKAFVLACRVLHADETPVALLDPGAGKTRKAYVWAYARSWHDVGPGVVYEFCLGRGAQYPKAFLAGDVRRGRGRWSGTLLTDRYAGYDSVLDPRIHTDRISAACVAHYLERGFIFTPMRDTAGSQRRWGDAQLQINPAQTTCLCIRSGLSCVFRSYGHPVLQDTSIRAHAAPCPRHPARLGRGSRRQRRYSAAVPAVDRQVSALLLHSRP